MVDYPKRQTIVINTPTASGSYGGGQTSLFFANPLVPLLLIVLGFVIFVMVAGTSFSTIITLFQNIAMWFVAVVIGIVISFIGERNRTSALLVFSFILSVIFWYQDIYSGYAQSIFHNIPFIGTIIDIATFIPLVFVLGLYFMVAFTMVWLVAFIIKVATE